MSDPGMGRRRRRRLSPSAKYDDFRGAADWGFHSAGGRGQVRGGPLHHRARGAHREAGGAGRVGVLGAGPTRPVGRAGRPVRGARGDRAAAGDGGRAGSGAVSARGRSAMRTSAPARSLPACTATWRPACSPSSPTPATRAGQPGRRAGCSTWTRSGCAAGGADDVTAPGSSTLGRVGRCTASCPPSGTRSSPWPSGGARPTGRTASCPTAGPG